LNVISPLNSFGRLVVGHRTFPCKLGRSGIKALKREGDGATPRGSFRMLAMLHRSDRQRRFQSTLPGIVLTPASGWCDDPLDRNYNRPVKLPYPGSHEQLFRKDQAYDALVVLDYNISPRTKGGGSAIFFHLTRDGIGHTEGCIAVSALHMRQILSVCGPKTTIVVRL
jgi:L,D-peptidoglycan transpeptidase YkuD (ErfK/YbiS/YcfS/YnhG family)